MGFFLDSYPLLLVCRAFNGFFNGNFVVAMATAADISTKENRLKNMSAIGATISLSWILGPMVGGLVSSLAKTPHQTIHLPFLASTIFSVLALIFVITLFPNVSRQPVPQDDTAPSKVLREFFTNLMNKKVLFYAGLNVLFFIIITGCQIYFTIWTKNMFQLSVSNMGLTWGLFGITALLGQLTINKFLYKVNSHTLIIIGFLTMGLSLMIWGFSQTIYAVYGAGMLMYHASAFAISGINTRVSLSGRPHEMGMVFGINQTFSSLGRVLSGSFFGALVSTLGYTSSWLIVGAIFVAVALICAVTFKARWLEKY